MKIKIRELNYYFLLHFNYFNCFLSAFVFKLDLVRLLVDSPSDCLFTSLHTRAMRMFYRLSPGIYDLQFNFGSRCITNHGYHPLVCYRLANTEWPYKEIKSLFFHIENRTQTNRSVASQQLSLFTLYN